MKYQINIKTAAAVFLMAGTLAGCGLGNKNAAVNEGMAAVESLDYEAALTSFDKAIMEKEDMRLIYRGQGLAYMGMTMYAEAVEAFEKALRSSDGRPDDMDYDINYYLATAYYKLGQKEQSIKAYDAILQLRPKDKQAYYLRGSMKIESSFEEAQADFDKAISLDNSDYSQLVNIYNVLERYGYKELGQQYLNTALEEGGKSMSDYEKGRIYFYLGDFDNARNFLEKARNEEGYEAVLLLGRTYETLGEGEYNYAISVYQSFLDKDQTKPIIYNQLGLCRMKMGNYQEALQAFQDGMKLENNEMLQTFKFNEIVTYEKLGEYQQAAVLLDNYLKTYPDDEAAKREFIFLKTR